MAAFLSRNGSAHVDEAGSIDLGGVTLNLQGGDYLISAPLVIPSNYSNFRVQGGTLRASSSFPADRYLIEVGTPGSTCVNWGDSCNEDGSFSDLFLDASLTAAGGMRFWAVIGMNAGPNLFILNYTVAGVDIEGGHEVLLHESWLGEYMYTGSNWTSCDVNVATGVLMNGNDHYMTNSIVFAGAAGVVINGAANILNGVHTWNCPSSVGIRVTEWQNRLVGCYLDYVDLQLYGAAMTTVTDSFFLGPAHISLEPGANGYPVQGVVIANNQFMGLNTNEPNVALNMSNGFKFSGVVDVTITGSMLPTGGGISLSTAATKVVNISTATSDIAIDFADALLFDTSTAPIRSLQYSLQLANGSFVRHAAAPVGNSTVVHVLVDAPITGVITVSVDQSTRTAGVS